MSKSKTVAYPGTFDPITKGHESIIKRATKIFDQLVIAVAKGVHKDPLFTLDERVEMTRKVVSAYDANIEVLPVEGLLSDFLTANSISTVLRGMRSVADFEFEIQLADINRRLANQVETLFMAPNTDYIHVNSRIVREIAELGGDVSHYVSPVVAEELINKLKQTS